MRLTLAILPLFIVVVLALRQQRLRPFSSKTAKLSKREVVDFLASKFGLRLDKGAWECFMHFKRL